MRPTSWSLAPLFLALAAATASAQPAALRATAMVRDTNNLYLRIDVQGPSRGAAMVYMGLPLRQPFLTPYGRIDLDPTMLVPIELVALDLNGMGAVNLSVPIQSMQVGIGIQAVVFSATQAQITNSALLAVNFAVPGPDGSLSYTRPTGAWGTSIMGPPGTTVQVQIAPAGGGAPIPVSPMVVIGAAGIVTLNGVNALAAGDKLQVVVNGAVFLEIP